MECDQERAEIKRVREIFAPYDIRKDVHKYSLQYPKTVREASVLIPLLLKEGHWKVLLTLRSSRLAKYAGQVTFPGGRRDASDIDHIHTALREAEEEVGLIPDDVEILAVLPHAVVYPDSLASVVLGVIPSDFTPNINIREVSLVFHLPLQRFLSTDRLQVTAHNFFDGLTYHLPHFKDTVGDTVVDIHGFTAIYCIKLAVGILQSDQTFNFTQNDATTSKHQLFSLEDTKLLLNRMILASSKL